jgi:hypothetical protein
MDAVTSLHNLVANAQGIRAALAAGADPDERDAAGSTPLHTAGWGADLDRRPRPPGPRRRTGPARDGDLELAKVLLERGASLEAVDRPEFLHVDVRGDAAEVARRRDEAVAAILRRTRPGN